MATFGHAPTMWSRFADLTVGVVRAEGIDATADVETIVRHGELVASERLAAAANGSESGLESIAAWRRVYAGLGYKPTQYRSAAESLLRRLRKSGSLPRVHPLVDLCNALSAAYAVPIAAFDRGRIDGDLTVRPASGEETYRTFADTLEHPESGEIIYADAGGRAHARRWVNRQSGESAVSADSTDVLIVAEAVHPGAGADIDALCNELTGQLRRVWGIDCRVARPTAGHPLVELTAGQSIP